MTIRDTMTLGGQFTVRQIALAWLRHRSPTVMPIPGTSSVAHLEDDVAAADLQLDDADLAQLDEVARN